jgi:predicted secreted protein
MRSRVMTEQDGESGATEVVRAKVGGSVEVTLDEIPSSGYQWNLPDVPRSLSLMSVTWADPMPSAVGASRRRRFVLRADELGDYELRFALRRPWEPEATAPSAHERTVLVHVDPAGNDE